MQKSGTFTKPFKQTTAERFGASTYHFFCIKQRLCKHCFKNELTSAWLTWWKLIISKVNHLSDSSLEANRISRIYDNATKTLWMSICRATFWKLNMVDCLRRPASFDQLSDKISRLESLQVERQNSSFILQDCSRYSSTAWVLWNWTGDPPFCNQVQVQKIFNFFVYILVTSLRN